MVVEIFLLWRVPTNFWLLLIIFMCFSAGAFYIFGYGVYYYIQASEMCGFIQVHVF